MSVQSVTRAIDLIKTLAANPDGLGLTALSHQTNLHKSTAFRLLSTLEKSNVITRTEYGKRYVVADAFSALFGDFNAATSLMTAAKPCLGQLSAFASEDAGLAMLAGDQAHFIDQVVASEQKAVQVRDWVDSRFLLHEVAAGRIMLAFRGTNIQQRYAERYCAENATELLAELKTAQRQGYAWLFDANDTGLTAIAGPIFDDNGKVIASICLFGPNFRFPAAGFEQEIAQRVVTLSAQLTQAISGALRR